ncbi:MAG: ABC transporter substrate-binding protein [Defluviitaleaceae bacterium]|nr:ABC transporter substrate-binding protein [Defluviitaleaceae bacterium]
MKKHLLMTLLLLVLVVPFTACGNNDNDDDVSEITIWAWDPNFNLWALEIASEFFAYTHPHVDVNIEETSQDEITMRMNVAFGAGTMDGMANIVLVENYRAQIFLRPFSNYFYPVDAYVNRADFAQFLIPWVSHGGQQFGIPFDNAAVGWYVRTDILAQAGFTPADLMYIDWYEAIEIARVVYAATGIPMSSHDPTDISGFIRPTMMAAGSWYTPDGVNVNFNNNPVLRRSIEVWQTLLNSGVVANHSDWGGYIGSFTEGRTWSVVPAAIWITPSVRTAMEQAGNWALVPMPNLPGFPGHYASWGGSSWYVLDVPGREYAAQFLGTTWGGSIPFNERLLSEVGALTMYQPFTTTSGWIDAGQPFFANQQPVFDYFSRWAAQIPQINPGIHTYRADSAINETWIQIHGGTDIDTALNNAQHYADTQIMVGN